MLQLCLQMTLAKKVKFVSGINVGETQMSTNPVADVNPECAMPHCSEIKDSSTGALIVLQRYLAYASIVDFSNYWYSLYDSLSFAGVVGTAETNNIITVGL